MCAQRFRIWQQHIVHVQLLFFSFGLHFNLRIVNVTKSRLQEAKLRQSEPLTRPRITATICKSRIPSVHSVASFPDPGMAWYLCKNRGNFTQSEQTVSVATTPSIINSLVLSFPWSNHSTQHAETQPVAPDPVAAALWERLQACKDEYTHIPTVTVGASGPVWLCEPARKRNIQIMTLE